MQNISSHTRLPKWLKKKTPVIGSSLQVNKLLRDSNLHTVCHSAKCPNLLECFGRGTATFLIMGDVCTRRCRFCAVTAGTPVVPDPGEPDRVATVVSRLKLKHVVVTSVTRDDLPDGGAGFFARTIRTIKKLTPNVVVEVLVPDFQGNPDSVKTVVAARPDIFNHNLETVPRLYGAVRPEADYRRSLSVLALAKENDPAPVIKSGLLLGLGEEKPEVIEVLNDLREINCDMLTIGQYLRPSLDRKNVPVEKFITPAEFEEYKKIALELGFSSVASGPYVRSSYSADKFFSEISKP
ncbi:MAG: lipoyl synthase [Planctomycetes bacterium]|nr:lipoyl synthase [Planctomycetota bacterium]